MSINKIICFGDGYAANHIWPEWSAIVAALYPDIAHENFGAVGAGNEFIATAVVQAHMNNPNDFFLVQWAPDQRLDKLLQDSSWDRIIDSDPVYHFNRVILNQQTWWLSSASQQKAVKDYHDFYIQNRQAALRSMTYKYLIENLLKNQGMFFELNQMMTFSKESRFEKVRQNQVQPSPIVHMAWVEEKILPKMPIKASEHRVKELKNRINQHEWKPYDPDREEIWNKMSVF